jgi:hypothetical protein
MSGRPASSATPPWPSPHTATSEIRAAFAALPDDTTWPGHSSDPDAANLWGSNT